MYDVKFLALLVAPYIYDISRLRVNYLPENFVLWHLLYSEFSYDNMRLVCQEEILLSKSGARSGVVMRFN
jgi:hypothetical protein